MKLPGCSFWIAQVAVASHARLERDLARAPSYLTSSRSSKRIFWIAR